MNNTFLCKCGLNDLSNITIHLEKCIYPKLNIENKNILIFSVERVQENDRNMLVDDYTINKLNKLWLIISIYNNSSLEIFLDIIKDKWLQCCKDNKHKYDFIFDECNFSNNEITKFNRILNGSFKSNTKISSIFTTIGTFCILEYDAILSTYLKITLINTFKSENKKIKVKINKTRDLNYEKILLFNNEYYMDCCHCANQLNNYYCKKCKKQICNNCIDNKEHKCYKKKSSYILIKNDPRTCINCLDLDKYKNGRLATLCYEKMCK